MAKQVLDHCANLLKIPLLHDLSLVGTYLASTQHLINLISHHWK